jgi:hypothetical protein
MPTRALQTLAINAHAPLASWRAHLGSRLKLGCAACGWSKTYDPERIAGRLTALKKGGAMTPISAVAGHVPWPCPRCQRMRWSTVLVGER